MRDAEKTIGKMLDKQSICFVASVDAEEFPNVKAMLKPRKRNSIKEIWFSTSAPSLKVQSFRNNPKACVYVCDKRFFRGAMLKGTVEVLEDVASKEMIWHIGDTMYCKKGVTDPDYCVLKFTAVSARYCSNFKSENAEIEEPDFPNSPDGKIL